MNNPALTTNETNLADWSELARGILLDPRGPFVLALSGGADSVFLAHVLARAAERPRVLAVHVDHGLRGDESAGDARFAEELARTLGFEFECARVELDPRTSGLEARARAARYRACALAAAKHQIGTVLSAHQADDALETLLLRWLRGATLASLAGLKARVEWTTPDGARLLVARPLLALRRERIRELLRQHEIAWREDSSNAALLFARNRVREGLLPWLAQVAHGGEDALFALLASLREQDRIALTFTGALCWSGTPPRVERAPLARLPPALRERVLWRLVRGAHAHAMLARALHLDQNVRVHLVDGSVLRLDAQALWHEAPSAPRFELVLRLGQPMALPAGGLLSAELVECGAERPFPRTPNAVELDVTELDPAALELCVRTARPGDRFHALGARGSRRLVRFLADAGVPRERRGALPLVFLNGELVWAVGLRPCHARQIRATTRRRLCLGFAEPR